ncbi:hypothetical protein [Inoviridae sp.]|nr:hypothetical protein [Inoviridae sp.]
MFRQVWIVQCRSSGEFLTYSGFYTYNLNQAGFFGDKQSAIDTAEHSLDVDFAVYDFYKRESELPAYMAGQLNRVSGFTAPPM